MRKVAILAILAAITLTGHEAQASQRRGRPAVSAAPAAGPFSRLMELERRKNAALRQAFFGR